MTKNDAIKLVTEWEKRNREDMLVGSYAISDLINSIFDSRNEEVERLKSENTLLANSNIQLKQDALHFIEENKRLYSIIERAKNTGEIEDWLKEILDEAEAKGGE